MVRPNSKVHYSVSSLSLVNYHSVWYYYCYSFSSFSPQRYPMISHWVMSDSKSPQVFRTLLSILADLNKPVIWMVSIRPFISKSTSPSSNPLVTVPRTPITIGIMVTFIFLNAFKSQARSKYLFFYTLSFNFNLWSAGTAKSTIQQVLFFCCLLLQGLIVWPGLGDPFVSPNPREVCTSHFPV